MKKFVDIVSIIAVSILLIYCLKKAIQLGTAKPVPKPPAVEQQGNTSGPPPEESAPSPEDVPPPNMNDNGAIPAPALKPSNDFGKTKL